MSFVFLTLTASVSLIVIAISAFIINNLKNQIHNLKIAFNNLEIEKTNLENELGTNKNLLETELFMNEENERIIKSRNELAKYRVLSQCVSSKCLDDKFDDNKYLFNSVCLLGNKVATAFMLETYPNELKNKRVLYMARCLVERSQTTLNKKAMLGLLRKEILLITYSHQVSLIQQRSVETD
jgi:hypothetical protein